MDIYAPIVDLLVLTAVQMGVLFVGVTLSGSLPRRPSCAR